MASFYRRAFSMFIYSVFAAAAGGWAGDDPGMKPVPRMQVIPLPYDQVSYQCDGRELTRYHYGASLKRPFMHPILGPAGRSLTRMGHPRDQESHKHHYSFWVSHNDVNGVSFWSDQGEGTIAHKRIVEFEDGDDRCYTVTQNDWLDGEQKAILHETRRISVIMLKGEEWMLVLDLAFTPAKEAVVLGDTPFGMTGVRMAKTIGVHDGGGMIRNSEGDVNEEEAFRKKARWVDYAGRITNEAVEGIALFDHPANPNHPAPFHVRNDGWMGACLTHQSPITIQPGETLKLRYGLYIHRGLAPLEEIDATWRKFAEMK
ncbi:MAG: PmoA family protein [Candidatus Omnitrophica bacterium]|nr:PmoA family protein [Candidatus Omnitrophota bacterium]